MTTETEPTSSGNGVAVGAILASLLALLLGIFATGTALSARDAAGGGGGGGGGGASSVTVSAKEFSFTPSDPAVAEGGSITLTNDGTTAHNLTIRGTELATADINAGESTTLSLEGLAAGTYTIFCSIPGHEAGGMAGTITVGTGGTGGAGDGAGLTGMAKAEWLRANYDASVDPFLEAATTGVPNTEGKGNQYLEPTIETIDGVDVKVFELTLDEIKWEVSPGKLVDAVAYNGQIPGPIIQANIGDTIKVIVNNELEDQATTLHPHGVKMHPNHADGVGHVTMDPIMPHESWSDVYTADALSIGMYHGHDNGLQQVINGSFGAFLIGDIATDAVLPASVNNITQEHVMVLNDAGNIGLTLNAKSFPATEPYVMGKGEQMVMTYYNEGLTAHPMHLHNQPQLVVAKDGYMLDSPYYVDTINVAPGERYTVIIFGETPGAWVYHCHILSHVEKEDGSVFGMFTALIVTDPDAAPPAEGDTATEEPSAADGSEAASEATSS